jgi:hypothetical protein
MNIRARSFILPLGARSIGGGQSRKVFRAISGLAPEAARLVTIAPRRFLMSLVGHVFSTGNLFYYPNLFSAQAGQPKRALTAITRTGLFHG